MKQKKVGDHCSKGERAERPQQLLGGIRVIRVTEDKVVRRDGDGLACVWGGRAYKQWECQVSMAKRAGTTKASVQGSKERAKVICGVWDGALSDAGGDAHGLYWPRWAGVSPDMLREASDLACIGWVYQRRPRLAVPCLAAPAVPFTSVYRAEALICPCCAPLRALGGLGEPG